MKALGRLERRDCPICKDRGEPVELAEGNVSVSELDAFAFASRKRPEYVHHRLVRCGRCDLVYADPAPAAEDLHAAYLEAAFDSVAEARRASATYGAVLGRIVSQLPSRSGALDVGTGDGSFLAELQRRAFTQIVGVEPSSAPIAAATPLVRHLIRQDTFHEGLAERGSLSLVTCFQTIEHVPDPLGLCRQAAGMLRPGGALLLVAHNRVSISARVLGRRSPIFDVEHLQLFSPRSARNLLRTAGYRGVRSWPIVNRYAVDYWVRLLPLPRRFKAATLVVLGRTRLGSIPIPLPAGNMAVVGFRPER